MPAFDPPALTLVALGLVALLAWLVLAPPSRRSPASAALQALAAIALALLLVNAGWRGGGGERPRLVVLLDRSESMSEVGGEGTTRLAEARSWLDGDDFAHLTAGWSVEVDSFGGSTTDPAAAIEAASATLPAAILVVSDGRATTGGAGGAAPVPVYARIPGPVAVADAAVLDLRVEEDDGGAARAVVQVAAAGGMAVPARSLVVLVDGREAGRATVPAMGVGERREIRVALPSPDGTDAVVEARLGEPADAVAGNDTRARAWRSSAELRTLLVGLAPGWELGFLHRALAASAAAPLDAYWGAREGALRSVDGGPVAGWGALDPARYETLWLIGDPALLGEAGRRWLDRFVALGGRGIFWGPGGRGGELAGGLRAPAAGEGQAAQPSLTAAGRRWLESVVGPIAATPDGTSAWPPIEGLPAARPEIPGGASVLLQAAGTPVAWSFERGGNRYVVALGSGWYRLALEGGAAREAPTRRFWSAWTDGLARWLAAASAEEAPLVVLPEAGRVREGEPLVVRRTDPAGALAWRIVPSTGGAEAASGVSEDGASSFAIGPLPAGAWRLELEADGRRERHAIAVETWSPDLARTEADTAGLARLARASGGAMVEDLASLPRAENPPAAQPGRTFGLALAPWAFLLAALLLLAHWAAGARAR